MIFELMLQGDVSYYIYGIGIMSCKYSGSGDSDLMAQWEQYAIMVIDMGQWECGTNKEGVQTRDKGRDGWRVMRAWHILCGLWKCLAGCSRRSMFRSDKRATEVAGRS